MRRAVPWRVRLRRLNAITHRDLGYFCSALIVAYCISGIALNHIDDWNPSFVIHRDEIALGEICPSAPLSATDATALARHVGEARAKTFDYPTAESVKLYFDNASLRVDLRQCSGTYERVVRRPVLFQANALHLNSVRGWKWASDIFALMLIIVSVTGVFVLRGRAGVWGRGKWWILAGFVPPIVALVFFEIAG